eukprot:scaffold1654_cov340-Prasinococcus_capsulatus_cf.AAC.3
MSRAASIVRSMASAASTAPATAYAMPSSVNGRAGQASSGSSARTACSCAASQLHDVAGWSASVASPSPPSCWPPRCVVFLRGGGLPQVAVSVALAHCGYWMHCTHSAATSATPTRNDTPPVGIRRRSPSACKQSGRCHRQQQQQQRRRQPPAGRSEGATTRRTSGVLCMRGAAVRAPARTTV